MARTDHMARLLQVARLLGGSRRGVPLKTLAERHGFPLRALYRDVTTLERAGFPIVVDEGRYRIDGEPPAAPTKASREELLALFLVRQLAGGWKDTSLGQGLDRLWSRLSAAPGETTALLPADDPGGLAIRGALAIDYRAHRKTIATLERAIAEGVAVELVYHALSTGETTRRTVEPGQLYFDPGLESLYFIAWCRLRREVRIFAVQRLRLVSLTAEQVKRRPEALSGAALQDAFRIWRSGAVERVVLDFSKSVADEIRERRWHASQSLEAIDGGGLRLCFECAGLPEIERWVLGYGGEVKVVAPAALAEAVGRKSAAAAARYGASPEARAATGAPDAAELIRRGAPVPARRRTRGG